MTDQWNYRGWAIDCDPKPIPVRDFDWSATQPDYGATWEGEETGWVACGTVLYAATYKDLILEIDSFESDLGQEAA